MNLPAELSCFDISKNLFLNKNLRAYLAPNYSVMFKELNELCDMTHEKIADVLPVSGASSVTEWARGGIPNYDNGEALIVLWMTLTNKTENEIPRLDRHLTNHD